ncbi:MAG: hypothetical protein EPO52_01475 [Herbiconiux sp.]|uniref:hypothetical protein n=1 Tax=Herbiconiux sp. TaxID=1871186 RepID=UPI0012097D1A|nr:hypothetical protein [Herbiconiux sp.]TAJ49657.1 MAG: hypothetical protein EPO52_01475 [Herbiconiux sp.]
MSKVGFRVPAPVAMGATFIALFGVSAAPRPTVQWPPAFHADPVDDDIRPDRILTEGAFIFSVSMPRETVQVGNASADSTQAYYWSEAWQTEEARSMAEHASGDYVRFDNVDDALAWLNEPEA